MLPLHQQPLCWVADPSAALGLTRVWASLGRWTSPHGSTFSPQGRGRDTTALRADSTSAANQRHDHVSAECDQHKHVNHE